MQLEKSKTNLAASLDKLFSLNYTTERRDFLTRGAALLTASVSGTVGALANDRQAHLSPRNTVSENDRINMAEAIRIMRQVGVVDQTGGPFGCVIVRNGQVLSATGNSVLKDNDPTAHAEVNAIRAACKKVGSFHLEGAVMYSSCECCPMCYSAAYWARISKIYYAASWSDYNDLFDDSKIHADIKNQNSKRFVPMNQIMQTEAKDVWNDYRNLPNRKRY